MKSLQFLTCLFKISSECCFNLINIVLKLQYEHGVPIPCITVRIMMELLAAERNEYGFISADKHWQDNRIDL